MPDSKEVCESPPFNGNWALGRRHSMKCYPSGVRTAGDDAADCEASGGYFEWTELRCFNPSVAPAMSSSQTQAPVVSSCQIQAQVRGQLFVKLSRSVALERFDGSCQNQALTRGPHSATQLHSVAMNWVAAVNFVKQYSGAIMAIKSNSTKCSASMNA